MKRLKTLRVRFALWTAGLLLAILSLFGILVYFSMAQSLAASIDASLNLHASQAAGGLDVEDGQLELLDSFLEEPANAGLRERGFTIRLLDPQGQSRQALGIYNALP